MEIVDRNFFLLLFCLRAFDFATMADADADTDTDADAAYIKT